MDSKWDYSRTLRPTERPTIDLEVVSSAALSVICCTLCSAIELVTYSTKKQEFKISADFT